MNDTPITCSIGGSLVVPKGGIDTNFLKNLNSFVRAQVQMGRRFLLIVGGGGTARTYRDAGKEVIGTLSDEDLDWLGIHATRLNAHLIRTIFQDIAHPRIVENYDYKLIDWVEPIAIGAGWKPGWSTDYDAVIMARDYGSDLIINMSNIDGIYDKDPKTHPEAVMQHDMTWDQLEKIIGTKWSPGLNAPFDPIAAQLAKKLGFTAIVANGEDFQNLEKIVNGEDGFKGTRVHP